MRASLEQRVLFIHPVAAGGYFTEVHLRPADLRAPSEEIGELYLTDGLPLELSKKNQIYVEPLKKNTALFLEFANLEPTPEAITKFANKYGLLGEGVDEPIVLEGASPLEEGEGNLVKIWFEESRRMKEVVDSWWSGFGHAGLYSGSSNEKAHNTKSDDESKPRQGKEASKGPLQMSKRALAANLLNVLAERISKGVVLEPVPLSVQAKGLLGLYLRPKSLLDAMWLQFAMAVEENKQFRQCSVCKGWMEVTPESRRQDAKYCSNKCRSKAYRERQKEARRLHAKGMSPAQIAKRMGTDTKTIKSWIGKEKPG